MSDIAKTVLHSTGQMGVALAAGAVIDAVFPDPGPDTGSDDVASFLRNSAEVVLQVSANALLAALMSRTLKSMNETGIGDPSEGFAFFFASTLAQPNLSIKTERLANYLKARVVNTTGSIEGAVDRLRGIPQTQKAPVRLDYPQQGQVTPKTQYH